MRSIGVRGGRPGGPPPGRDGILGLALALASCRTDGAECPCAGQATLFVRAVDPSGAALPIDSAEVSIGGDAPSPALCSGKTCQWAFYEWPAGPVSFDVTAETPSGTARGSLVVGSDELWIQDGCGCGGWSDTVAVEP
jgi:hypothetical protein